MKPRYDHFVSFVWVQDWEQALSFYSDVLGFTKAYESEGWAELAIPGIKGVYLGLNKWGKPGEAPPTNSFITFRVEDLDAFHNHLEANRVRFKGDIWSFDDEGQGMRMFKFYDPDGNVLTVSQIED